MHTPSSDDSPQSGFSPDFLPGVGAIEILARGLIHDQGHVLLCENLQHGYLYLPGGHVEPGESASAALAREMLEEAGVEVTPTTLALISESRFTQRGKPRHEYTLVFHVEHRLTAEAQVPPLEQHIGFRWAEFASISDLDVRPASAKAWLLSLDSSGAANGADWVSEHTK